MLGQGRQGGSAAFFRQLGRAAALLGAAWLASAVAAQAATGSADPEAAEAVERLSAEELETLVAPVALYPDDLLAVVLPASTYPLQVVLATRFLETKKKDSNAEPDSGWDEAIIALLNYPEALQLLNDDLDWTWRLGEAVLAQEEDLITAVSAFREKAKVAGNLQSDGKQDVAVEDGAIRIKSTSPTRIHVPYYEPAEVVVHQPYRVVYRYYPRAYPVYYYPYPRHHRFHDDLFWGVTSAFSVGWSTGQLHWYHYGLNDHPYFGYHYYDPFYYRRPHRHLRHYERKRRHAEADHHWRPLHRQAGARPGNPRRRDWRNEDPEARGRDIAGNLNRLDDRQDRHPNPDLRVTRAQLPATPGGRPSARTRRPGNNARDHEAEPWVNASSQVRTLPSGTARRPHPTGQGRPAVGARPPNPQANAAVRRSVPRVRREDPPRRPSPTVRPAETRLSAAQRTQIQQRFGTLNRPAAPTAASPRNGRATPRTSNAIRRPQSRRPNNANARPLPSPTTINAIPRIQRPAAPPRAQAVPRPNPPPQSRPGSSDLSGEAISQQNRRRPPPNGTGRKRKDIDHQ